MAQLGSSYIELACPQLSDSSVSTKYLIVEGKLNSQSTSALTSSVTIRLRYYLKPKSGNASLSWNTATGKIAGSTVYSYSNSSTPHEIKSSSTSKNDAITMGSKTITYTHKADGTIASQSVSYSWSASNGGSKSGTVSFTLPKIAVNPTISNVAASNIKRDSVFLTATVDARGNAITKQGWDVGLSTSSYTFYSGSATSQTISGLTPGTQYHYRNYVSTGGGSKNSSWYTFTTLAATAPTISNVAVNSVDKTTASLSWSESVQSSYSISSRNFNYRIVGEASWNSVSATAASVSLTNLKPGQNYEYEITITDNGNLTSNNATGTFKTLSASQIAIAGVQCAGLCCNSNVFKGACINESKILG